MRKLLNPELLVSDKRLRPETRDFRLFGMETPSPVLLTLLISCLAKAEPVPRLWSDQRRKKYGQRDNPHTRPDHEPFGLILKRRTLFLCHLQNACFDSYSVQ